MMMMMMMNRCHHHQLSSSSYISVRWFHCNIVLIKFCQLAVDEQKWKKYMRRRTITAGRSNGDQQVPTCTRRRQELIASSCWWIMAGRRVTNDTRDATWCRSHIVVRLRIDRHPAPLKLRPYGAIEIRLLLLLLLYTHTLCPEKNTCAKLTNISRTQNNIYLRHQHRTRN